VDILPLEDKEDIEEIESMIRLHADYTRSELAWRILALWEEMVPQFVKVFPKDFRRMLAATKRAEETGMNGDDAVMIAFEENKNNVARVTGN
jgi:glutamate synthase (ferredoxin)